MGLASAECWDANKCIFYYYKENSADILYSWDLRSLCNGGIGYTFDNVTNGNKYRFEICGTIDPIRPPYCGSLGCISPTLPKQTNTYCNPDFNDYPYTGSFLQFFDPNPKTQCKMGACPNEAGASGPQLLTDYCCTGLCEVIAYGNAAYNYRWIDGNNTQTGGIRWTAYGDAPDNGDDFTCPIDPNTGYPRVRTLYATIFCNINGSRSDPLVVNEFWDSGDCFYRVSMTHFAACGTEVYPTPSPSPSPSLTPAISSSGSQSALPRASGDNSDATVPAATLHVTVGVLVPIIVVMGGVIAYLLRGIRGEATLRGIRGEATRARRRWSGQLLSL